MTAPDPAEIFRQEAQELLEQLEQTLLDVEHNPADHSLVDTAFRALHTIKGSGAMFGFDAVAAFAHHLENAFDLMRQGKLAPSPQIVAVALAAKDHIRTLIESPADADTALEQTILADLRELAEPAAAAAPVPAARPAAADGPATWRVRFRLPADALASGTNPLLLLDELRSLGDATIVALTGDVPSLAVIEPSGCQLGWNVILTTEQPRTAIEDVFMFVIDDMTLDIARVVDTAEPKRLGDILVDRGDVAPEAIDAALSQQQRLGTLLVKAGEITEDKLAGALGEQQHLKRDATAAKGGGSSIRVAAERLDELMDRVGELVIAQSRLRQIAAASQDGQVKSIAEELERLALELRDTTMGIRMVPIGSLFGRFRRLVHDLARDLGKDVELVTVGEETELDKTVIERLNDPLVHLIRNAIDHGLETPAERAAAGKAATGRITLTARHAGAEVLISLVDDGRGLDRARILARAEERGLLPAGLKPSDAELWQVIFQPGFSTAKAVTNVSGRGVGMDVVKRTIDALRGTIDIASAAGSGSRMTLRLPLTLAIIDGLLIRVGTARFVLPLAAVEECVELSAEADNRSRGRNFLNIRDNLVPFLRLRELFGTTTPPDPYQKVVIVSAGESRVGLVVDQVIGDHQTVIKSLSKLHADVKQFSGATILGDGTVALILDVGHLVESGQQIEPPARAAE